jgi:hypothetical protein
MERDAPKHGSTPSASPPLRHVRPDATSSVERLAVNPRSRHRCSMIHRGLEPQGASKFLGEPRRLRRVQRHVRQRPRRLSRRLPTAERFPYASRAADTPPRNQRRGTPTPIVASTPTVDAKPGTETKLRTLHRFPRLSNALLACRAYSNIPARISTTGPRGAPVIPRACRRGVGHRSASAARIGPSGRWISR